MRIAIDISQAIFGTGVSTYTKSLVKGLLSIDKKNNYILFGGSLRRFKELKELAEGYVGPNVETKIFAYPPVFANLVWNRLHTMPIEKLLGPVDVLHTSDWTEPPSKAFKITTIHDLAPLIYPNLFPKDSVRDIVQTHRLRLSWVKKESARIIVPSLATKDDLIKLGFNGQIVRVIPEAPANIFKPSKNYDIEKLKKKYKISGRYVLAVGINARKNTERIIKAFDLAGAGMDLKLVFVGHSKYSKIEETRNIRVAGHVLFSELPVFYSGAEALIYPSLYEGYGMPILESFACGTPVVTSDVSSMPEVAGGAAVLVDPYDVNSIAEGITKALRGPKRLIADGFERVKQFSWEATAKQTLEVYNEGIK